ncbi:MAG: signal peptidase I [Lachnospiraceae bacterium]|nr:signal peptidase I [Lachnospiraceae bacterium]
MKKILNTIKDILVWGIMILAVGMMIFTVISVNTFDQNHRSLFGYKAFIVRSDSMSATDFDAGDVIFVKEVDPSTLQEGDIIAYISQNDHNYGDTVTHKIRRLTTTMGGEPGFITYGTTTNTDDEAVVVYEYILGKYTGNVPKVGTFFTFLKTTQGYILCIFIPCMLLILYEGFNCIQLFRSYKKEQMEEIEAERKQLEEERRQSAEMMKELQALKEQLAAKEENREN